MSRYLVLEVTPDFDSLDRLLDYHQGKETYVILGQADDVIDIGRGDVLQVKLPARPLVVKHSKDNDPRDPRQLYIEEAR